MNTTKTSITAIVVSHNEAHLLPACLERLVWCDQLIVVDLASTDNTREIAERYANLVLSHAFSPIVEPVRCFAAGHATNDWLMFIDPDEIVPTAAVSDIINTVNNVPSAGIVRLPWQFYFKGEPLEGTVWGGDQRSKRFLAHRQRAEIVPVSQSGMQLRDGFNEVTVPPNDDNHVEHRWINSYGQLLEKHIRLAWNEGPPSYGRGQRFNLWRAVKDSAKALKYSLIDRDGLRCHGMRGLILSAVYSAYTFLSQISLWRYQLAIDRPAANFQYTVPPSPAEVAGRIEPGQSSAKSNEKRKAA